MDIKKLINRKDIKITPCRKLILEVIASSKDHPSAEEIYRRAKFFDKKVSLATVYRTLILLQSHGLLGKLELQDNKARYELINDQIPHHYHLVDITNNNIIEFESLELDKITEYIAEELGYEITDHRFELYGRPKSGKR